MRHRHKRALTIDSGAKKKSVFIRQLLTNLMESGAITTTQKRAQVLKAEADKFLHRLLDCHEKYDSQTAVRREQSRIIQAEIFGEETGKKVLNEILPRLRETGKVSGFTRNFKVGFRKGDATLKVLVKLI